MASQGPLTTYLLGSTPNSLARATNHPFLAAAGQGTLPKPTLSQWLSQDRLYAQSYIRFIGLLLAKIRLPGQAPSSSTPMHKTPEQKAITVLIDALVNIRAELAFFEQTAHDYSLDLTAISPEEGGTPLTSCGPGRCITTSAGISSTGSSACPGFTGGRDGKDLLARDHSVNDFGPGSGSSDVGANSADHGLCRSQGECQLPAGSEACVPRPQFEEEPVQNLSPFGKVLTPAPASTTADSGVPERAEKGMDVATELERCGTISFCASRTTRAYIDMFMSAGSAGVSVLEGLAVLWATEVCYLRSWKFAAGFMSERSNEGQDFSGDADGGALRGKFIRNWTSVEFEGFVNDIGDVVDEMAGQLKGAEESELMRGRCLEWWKQILWLEEMFWPNVEPSS
jgi:thiaminase